MPGPTQAWVVAACPTPSQCWRSEGKRQPGCERGRKDASFWKHQLCANMMPIRDILPFLMVTNSEHKRDPEALGLTLVRSGTKNSLRLKFGHPIPMDFKASKTMCPFSLLGLTRIMQTKSPTGCPCYGHSTSPEVWFSTIPSLVTISCPVAHGQSPLPGSLLLGTVAF